MFGSTKSLSIDFVYLFLIHLVSVVISEDLNSESLGLEFVDNSTIRLSDIRMQYADGLLSESDVIDSYREWVKIPYYGVVYRSDKAKCVIPFDGRGRSWYECCYKVFKLSKRGNDVYRARVRSRFKPLSDLVSLSSDWKFLDFSKRTGVSNLLFTTLTFDTKRCSKDTAWSLIGQELNLFLSNLKKRYGSIQVLRCFESFKKTGYPHIHLIIRFGSVDFPMFRYRDKKGRLSFRLNSKFLNELRSYWHSYIHVEGVLDMGAVGYLLKYITKEMYTSDDYSTVAHLWLYSKQSYSVSCNFVSELGNDVLTMPISLLDTYRHNSNWDDFNWSFLCSVRGVHDHEYWTFEILDFFDYDSLSEMDGKIEFSKLFSKYI